MKFSYDFKLSEHSGSSRVYVCGDITARIDFLSGSMMRVALFRDDCKMLPTFTVDPQNEFLTEGRDKLSLDGFSLFAPQVNETADGERFSLENVEAELNTHNFVLSYKKDGKLLFADRAPLAYNFQNEFGNGTYHYLTREKGEKIYGLGDKSGSVNKAGRTFRIETSDSMGYDAETSDPLYKHVPFYMCENSVGCYGIYYDTSDSAVMDFGREINNYYPAFKFFKSDDNCLVYYVFFGSKLEILRQYCSLCGKQTLPPKWSFDYCASTMAYTDAPNSEEQLYGFLRKLDTLNMSCSGFYLSSGYTSIGDLRCVFNWNYDKFPNPAKFIERFNSEKIHLIPNIKPAFLTSHPMYNEIAEKGLFVKNEDGTPFVTEFWDGMGSYIDFTLPEGFKFWHDNVAAKLLDYGIDATWNDNNEFDIKDTDAVANGFKDGSVKASRIRPILTYLMVASSYSAQTEKYPGKRPFLSTRSGSSAVRRLATTWSGDNFTSFHDLRYCHYIGMTLSLSGFFFYGHDLGGFSGDMPSRELLLRWMQHGIFEPRFTIHSWNSDGSATMPWSYPDAIPAARKIMAERKKLIPYLYNSAFLSVENDVPMTAPLLLYYGDKEIDCDSTSFLVGRDILAACILDEGVNETEVYLPKNEIWYLNDKVYDGGTSVMLNIPSDGEVPYFVRGGSVIATDEGEYGFKSSEKLRLTVYPLRSGSFKSEFFTDDGESFSYKTGDCVHLLFTVDCDSEYVRVRIENIGEKSFTPDIVLCDADDRILTVE